MNKLLTTLAILLIATASYAQTYTIERVIDGDTIVVTTSEGKSEEVDLIGIDAPESQPNDKAKRDAERTGKDLETITKMGQEAMEFVKGLITPGQYVRLRFDNQERDKYGRLLAYVFTEGYPLQNECVRFEGQMETGMLGTTLFYWEDCKPYNFINGTLIVAGYATPMTIPPNVKYAGLFKKLYKEAREEKRGLWKDLERIEGNNDVRHDITSEQKNTTIKLSLGQTLVEYSDDADNLVLSYSVDFGELGLGPHKILRVYGDGRVKVRIASPRKHAGNYSLQLSPDEMVSLLQSMVDKGFVEFEPGAVESEKRAAQLASGLHWSVMDASIIEIELHLDHVDKTIRWYALRHDAKDYPNLLQHHLAG